MALCARNGAVAAFPGRATVHVGRLSPSPGPTAAGGGFPHDGRVSESADFLLSRNAVRHWSAISRAPRALWLSPSSALAAGQLLSAQVGSSPQSTPPSTGRGQHGRRASVAIAMVPRRGHNGHFGTILRTASMATATPAARLLAWGQILVGASLGGPILCVC